MHRSTRKTTMWIVLSWEIGRWERGTEPGYFLIFGYDQNCKGILETKSDFRPCITLLHIKYLNITKKYYFINL